MPTKDQIAVLRTISTEFGSALNEEITQIKTFVDSKLSTIDAAHIEAKRALDEKLAALESKIEKAMSLDSLVSDISEGMKSLSQQLYDLPDPLSLESVMEAVDGHANGELYNRVKEYVEVVGNKTREQFDATFKLLESELQKTKDGLNSAITALQKELYELEESESTVDIDLHQLAGSLGENEYFTEEMKTQAELIVDEFIAQQEDNLKALAIEQFEKSMNATTKLVEAYLQTIKKPEDGLGLGAEPWQKDRVFRKDSIVTAHMGQFYRASADTFAEPGKSEDWERLTSFGWRWRGVKPEQETLKEGDLFVDEGSLFLVINEKARLIVKRGKEGRNGRDGKDGRDGVDGKDAPMVVDDQIIGTKRVIVYSDGQEHCQEVAALVEMKAVADQNARIVEMVNYEFKSPDDNAIRLRWFRGPFQTNKIYEKGDIVSVGDSLHLAIKKPPIGTVNKSHWIHLGGGENKIVSPTPMQSKPLSKMFSTGERAVVHPDCAIALRGTLTALKGHTYPKIGFVGRDQKLLPIEKILSTYYAIHSPLCLNGGQASAFNVRSDKDLLYATVEQLQAEVPAFFTIEIDGRDGGRKLIRFSCIYTAKDGNKYKTEFMGCLVADVELSAIQFGTQNQGQTWRMFNE